MTQTDLLTMLAGADSPAPSGVPGTDPREDSHGPAERLFEPVWTMPGQTSMALDTDR